MGIIGNIVLGFLAVCLFIVGVGAILGGIKFIVGTLGHSRFKHILKCLDNIFVSLEKVLIIFAIIAITFNFIIIFFHIGETITSLL